ncbi:unnamed protein product [Durusdinium trenchii]|uniref:NHR domain-containing protein n=1 Tax=Durusdinium trenchii TaxID=1381693 RepID=A0ABP0KM78_9DINO
MVAGGKSRGTGTKPPRSSQVPVSQVEPYPNRRLSGSAYVPVHVDVPRLPGSAYLPPGAACTPPAVPSRRLSAPHLPAVAHVAAGAPVGALEPVGPSVPGPHIPVYAPAACEVYEEEDLQEYFQLGDEASNIYGNWRAPWAETAWTSEAEPEPVPEFDHQEAFRQEVMPDATESQFLALLDSLETRVELMSQMQKTRNAIHQVPGYDRREDRTSPHLSSHASPKKQEDLLDVSQTIDTNQLGGKHNFSDNFDDKEPNYESLARQMVMPFSREICGLNLEFSEDGYRATRVRGCRQSVAIGRAPLPFKEYGRYFEIVVTETVPGWVGGLGIGITPDPRSLKRLPDKAWRIPKTSVLGYWGCAFLDGSEFRTSWHPDTLETGTKVGFLATSTGDFVLFVEGEAMVHIERAIPQEDLTKDMHPVVDVFAATRAVSLSSNSSPPPKPWACESIAPCAEFRSDVLHPSQHQH